MKDFVFKKSAGLQASFFPETGVETNIFNKLKGDTYLLCIY